MTTKDKLALTKEITRRKISNIKEDNTMKIKYVWYDQPNVEKVFDTVHAFAIMPRIFKRDQTQEEYDAFELQNFASKKEQGLVLAYEVIASE